MVNVNDAAEQGDTALHLACQKGHTAVIQVLMEAGACPTVLDAQNMCAVDYLPLPDQYTPELKRLAYAMISTDPAERPDLGTVCEVAKTMKLRSQGDQPRNIPRPDPPPLKPTNPNPVGAGEEGGEEKGGEGAPGVGKGGGLGHAGPGKPLEGGMQGGGGEGC